jgi:hypothetical protein
MDGGSEKLRSVELLNLRRLPARLNAEEAAILLGFKSHDLPLLIRAGLLRPLASGPRNCVKYFSSAVLERLARDEKWLDRATKAVLRGRTPKTHSGDAPHGANQAA